MRVADFFCGAGGFSEGFRQAGFKISFAVDKWLPAVNTYRANKPNAIAIQDDVIRISNLPDEEFHRLVPDTEVIIGSPPCVAFSSSNKSGNGDKEAGIQLLEAYLRIVARKKYKKKSILRYWVLENVPNIDKFIKNEYSAQDLNLEGDFYLQTKFETSGIYNAKYFGAPTNRKRFLCGDFPAIVETATNDNALTWNNVLGSLGNPLLLDNREVVDCNYPDLVMNANDISDFQYEYVLQKFEWEKAKRQKLDKGYMGKMSFPEDTSKPSRTIMATMSTSSRESMILKREAGGYRLPTVREVACAMSFPNDYRFYGTSKGTKYALVGNAVPPKLSFAVAMSILNDSGEPSLGYYPTINHDKSISFVNLNGFIIEPKVEKRKRETAKFKYHIPYLIVSAFRVELSNRNSNFSKKKIKWDAEIHFSQGKSKAEFFTPKEMVSYLSEKDVIRAKEFINSVSPLLCSEELFQQRFCSTTKEREEIVGPFELLQLIRDYIDHNFLTDKTKVIFLKEIDKEIPEVIIIAYYILYEILMGMRNL